MANNLRCILRAALLTEPSKFLSYVQRPCTTRAIATTYGHRTADDEPLTHPRAHIHDYCHTVPPLPTQPGTAALRHASSGGAAPSFSDAATAVARTRSMSTLQESVDQLLAKLADEPDHDEQLNALATFFTRFDGEAILLQTGVLGKLQPQSSEVLKRLSTVMRSTAAQFTLQQATNCLSTMTLLGHYDVPLKASLVNKVLPEIADAPPATIASLCYSLGLAGYSDRSLLRELENVVTARQKDFEVRDLAKVLWMFGRAHYNNVLVADLVQNLAKRALSPSASAQDLVYGMWACGIHDSYDQELAERVVQVVPSRLGELSGGELAKLAFALVEEDVRDPGLFEAIMQQASATMDGMFPRDIAKLLYALGRAQVTDRAFVAAVKPHVLHHLDRFTHNELDMIMSAYNGWGVHDDTVTKVAQQMRRRS